MRVTRAAVMFAAGAACLALLSSGCGSGHPGSPVDGGTSGGSASGARANTAGSLNLGSNLGGSPSGDPGVHDPTNDCAGDLVEAKPVPLDMYVMLDVSASMLDPTEGNPQLTKWAAVQSALIDFVSDPASDGLGVGLQVFPLPHPQAPAQCTTNQQCGAFGPCFLRVCWPLGDAIQPCETTFDCDVGTCVTYGECANDPTYVCRQIGNNCGIDALSGMNLGACVAPPPSFCLNTADCRAASYAEPAAPIAELPAAAPALVNVINAAMPEGATPSGPALTGAIQAASAWASDHIDHQVVAVLATDGQPTLTAGGAAAAACVQISDVAEITAIFDVAANGRAATPSISTFVIGVMGPNDVSAPTILDSIAQAGGTEQAFIVDTTGNVNQQFRDALNQIRAGRLSCELLLPAPEAGKSLDFNQINVEYDDGSGAAAKLSYAASEAACLGTGGWHYDVDPDAGGTPTRIVACPSTCAEFGRLASGVGSVKLELGCKTRTPVK